MAEENAYTLKSFTEKVIDRQRQYEAMREPLDAKFADIIDLTQPGYTAWEGSSSYSSAYGTGIWDDGVVGKFRGQKIYDSTPAWGLRTMAHGWLGSMVSETLPWFKYLFPDSELRGNDEVNAWMQRLEDAMYSVYRKSQLYEALPPYALGALSVGSPIILPYDDVKEDRISCEVPHPKENYHGAYDGYHRKYKIAVVDAVNRFMGGKVPDNIEDAKLSHALLTDWRNGKHAARHEFIRAIYRQDDPILDGQPARMKNKPWMEFYVETPDSGADKQVKKDPVSIGGYFTKPHIRWDYEKNTDEYYARTPSWNAIQDIKSFEEIERQKLEVGQRNLKPTMWMQRQYRNQFTGNPGSVVYYDSASESQNKPEPILDGSNWQIGDEQSKQMRKNVERWYNTDFFLSITRLTSENTGSWPTLGQLLQLGGEKATVLGSQIGGFSNVMRQIDRRFFDIELRKGVHGALPSPPPIIEDYLAEQAALGNKNVNLALEMIGSLAQLQQRAETLGRSDQGLMIIERYGAIDPLTIRKVRLSVQMEKDLEAIRWSQEAIVPEDEYQEGLAEIAAREAEERQAAMGIEMAKASKDVSGPVDESSVMAQIGNAA